MSDMVSDHDGSTVRTLRSVVSRKVVVLDVEDDYEFPRLKHLRALVAHCDQLEIPGDAVVTLRDLDEFRHSASVVREVNLSTTVHPAVPDQRAAR